MAFTDATWPCGGDLGWQATSKENMFVFWRIGSFLRDCRQGERNELKSENFDFADATCNMFTCFDRKRVHSLVGINVRERRLPDAVFDCSCRIDFRGKNEFTLKSIKCHLRCESAGLVFTMADFLSYSELAVILKRAEYINCHLKIKESSHKRAYLRAAIYHFSSSDEDSHSEVQVVGMFKVVPVTTRVHKVCQDFKNLLLSEEGSDVTIQVGDQQFKAHRSVLVARSSVFAAMLRHDTKEKATGVVDVDDCDPSAFPALLEFLYCGNTDKISAENVFNVYASADKYQVSDLKNDCVEFMKNNLSIDTFCETARLSLMHSDAKLLTFALDYFAGNVKKIVSTEEWQKFILENPIQGNDIFIKAFAPDTQDDSPI